MKSRVRVHTDNPMNVEREDRPDSTALTVPAGVVAEWLAPFLEHLAKERRYSRYTVRNYRQAFEDFWCWLARSGLAIADGTAWNPATCVIS